MPIRPPAQTQEPREQPQTAHGNAALLQEAMRVCRDWMVCLPEHGTAIHLSLLLKDLIKDAENSQLAMSNVRALLCTNCRRLDASQGECTGKPLDRCPLLSRSKH